jgi:hypothetical protein
VKDEVENTRFKWAVVGKESATAPQENQDIFLKTTSVQNQHQSFIIMKFVS